KLVDEYNGLLGASGNVGHSTAPSLTAHITAFGLSTAMMAERQFPIPLLGMVHLQHKVWHMADIPIDQPVRISTSAQHLAPHHAGSTSDICVLLFYGVSYNFSWKCRAFLLLRSVNLPVSEKPACSLRPKFQPRLVTGEWKLPADIGCCCAAVSGDMNPVH